jgi:hypothetical protein
MRLEVDHLFRGNARGHGANGFSKAVGSDERASEGTCIYFMVAVVQYLCNEKVDGTVSRSWRPCTRSSPLRQSLALLQRIARRIIPLAVAVAADLTQPRSSVHAHGAGVCVIWYGIIPYPVPCHACINACCMVTVRYCCCFSSASAHQQLIMVPVVFWGGDSNTGAELVQCLQWTGNAPTPWISSTCSIHVYPYLDGRRRRALSSSCLTDRKQNAVVLVPRRGLQTAESH